MMDTGARKLQLIEAVPKTENEEVLQAMESLVAKDKYSDTVSINKFTSSLGTLSTEEAEAMKQVIRENFEKVNPDDWK